MTVRDWTLTEWIVDPETLRVPAAHPELLERNDLGQRVLSTREGLTFEHGPARDREVISWRDVKALLAEVPEATRVALTQLRDQVQAHRRTFPPFRASAFAQGAGPGTSPVTERRAAYDAEVRDYYASDVLGAWTRKMDRLNGERLRLHGEALAPGAAATGDLFDLLEEPTMEAVTPSPQRVPRPRLDAEVRACAEFEPGNITSGVTDAEAEFFTVYVRDADGLHEAVSDHPTRSQAMKALNELTGRPMPTSAAAIRPPSAPSRPQTPGDLSAPTADRSVGR